jgi:hypothetical protein
MFETVINLKPESEWRAGMTADKLIAAVPWLHMMGRRPAMMAQRLSSSGERARLRRP